MVMGKKGLKSSGIVECEPFSLQILNSFCFLENAQKVCNQVYMEKSMKFHVGPFAVPSNRLISSPFSHKTFFSRNYFFPGK
jgi:hypothetical protein